MCWICRIIGTYSDVNEENVIQTCCTDNILRPKKSLKWPVSRFHVAHYSSTNVFRQLCWILFLRLVRLKTELIFFLKVLRKKLIKIETRRIYKIRSLSHIHKRQQNYRSPQNLMCLPTVFNFLYYWKLIKIVSELVSTGSLKFGVSLKNFIVFAKPWLQL